jgi:hypothetical protein
MQVHIADEHLIAGGAGSSMFLRSMAPKVQSGKPTIPPPKPGCMALQRRLRLKWRAKGSPSIPYRRAISAQRWSWRSQRMCVILKFYRKTRLAALVSRRKLRVVYLCSDEAAFVTGANIAINGGQHMQ